MVCVLNAVLGVLLLLCVLGGMGTSALETERFVEREEEELVVERGRGGGLGDEDEESGDAKIEEGGSLKLGRNSTTRVPARISVLARYHHAGCICWAWQWRGIAVG